MATFGLAVLGGCGQAADTAASGQLREGHASSAAEESTDPQQAGDTRPAEDQCPDPQYHGGRAVGSLADDASVLPAVRDLIGDQSAYPAAGEVSLLFAGDVGASRLVVAVAPVRVPGQECSSSLTILSRWVLFGPSGASVRSLELRFNGDDAADSDERSVVLPDGDGVQVVAYPRQHSQPVEVGTVPIGSGEPRWSSLPALHDGWTSTTVPTVYDSAVRVRQDGDCRATLTTRDPQTPDRPGETRARRALASAGCTVGGG